MRWQREETLGPAWGAGPRVVRRQEATPWLTGDARYASDGRGFPDPEPALSTHTSEWAEAIERRRKVNCGTADHAADCLCDVRITEPTPINYPINKVLGSEYLTDDRWSLPWDATKIADYAEALLAAYDEYRRASAAAKRYVRRDRAQLLSLIQTLTKAGESMVDVPALLELTFDEMWAILRNGRPAFYEKWGDLDWLKFEAALDTFPPGVVNSFQLATALDYKPPYHYQLTLRRLAVNLYGRRQVSFEEIRELTKGSGR